jgi:hypothetical protein
MQGWIRHLMFSESVLDLTTWSDTLVDGYLGLWSRDQCVLHDEWRLTSTRLPGHNLVYG